MAQSSDFTPASSAIITKVDFLPRARFPASPEQKKSPAKALAGLINL
jgi:hypothetical protein